jgi:hypothetical protein
MEKSDLELFEAELVKDFQKINITSVVDHDKNLIIGDSNGNLTIFKGDKSKFTQHTQIQLKSKIESLIVLHKLNLLFVLSGGNLYFYDLLTFDDLSPKESDKEFKDLKDILKIAENKKPEKENEILIVNKKKKILFFFYNIEMKRLRAKEYKDKDKNPITFNLEEIPEKILWYDNNICYYTNTDKLKFITITTNNDYSIVRNAKEDVPANNIIYVNKSWIAVVGACGLYFDLEGQPITKSTLVFEQNDPLISLEVLNDFHIVALSPKNIYIFESKEGQCMQTLTIDNNAPEFKKKFLVQGKNKVFVATSNKKDEKSKDFIYKIWEVREFTFEKQIKLAINSNQIEKAFNILNNKLEYNEEKFKFLETFYSDCGWHCMKQRNKEGYKKAEIYFGLCNFNPFELIYHFIKLLKIKPIHVGFGDINKLPPEVDKCQIVCPVDNLDVNTKAALQMLIKVLQNKKKYIFDSNQVINVTKIKGKKKSYQSVKNNILNFDSSQNCPINLKDIQPTDLKLFETINIINIALINSMVLLGYEISFIEDIIEEENSTNNYSEEFFKNINTFTSNMTLACIYKKNHNYSKAFQLLEHYINNTEKSIENKEVVNLLKKILLGFGKNTDFTQNFEDGIKILLKNHDDIAFDVILYNEIIEIDEVLKKILPESAEPKQNAKREKFLKILCDDANYSNEKYQTLYLELLIKNLFSQMENKSIPKDKNEENNFPKEYTNLKEIIKKYDKYNVNKILELVKETWMYDIEVYLLSLSNKNEDAIKILIDLSKKGIKSFENIREFCKINYSKDAEIFKKYFKKLREEYDNKENKDIKLIFKKEMLKIIDLFIIGELLDKEEAKNKNKLELLNILNPKEILSLIPTDWKLNEVLDEDQKDKNNIRTIFNLMHFYLKEYNVINNNYKKLENLAKIDLTYKQNQLYELRDKHVSLDVSTCCNLCGKKIVNNTQLMIYPNGHIYHAKCSPDEHLEIKTGKNFKNFDY